MTSARRAEVLAPLGLRFRVRKASKYLFDCAGVDPADASALQRLALAAVRAEELAALGIDEVDVRKRLGLAEVDRMIACCPTHPPEAVVAPAAPEHREQFERFAEYLSARKRAGVAPLSGGVMLLLAPLPGTHGFLRCVVITTAATDRDSGAVAVSSAPLPKKLPSRVSNDGEKTLLSPAMSMDAVGTGAKPDQARPGRKRPRHDRSASLDESTTAQPSTTTTNAVQHSTAHNHQSEAGSTGRKDTKVTAREPDAGHEAARNLGTATIYELNWRTRKALVAQLRQEHASFHASRYEALRKWSERAAPPP